MRLLEVLKARKEAADWLQSARREPWSGRVYEYEERKASVNMDKVREGITNNYPLYRFPVRRTQLIKLHDELEDEQLYLERNGSVADMGRILELKADRAIVVELMENLLWLNT